MAGRSEFFRKQLYLTNKQVRRLNNMSTKSGLTVSELIRRAIDAYLKEQEPASGERTVSS